MAAKRQCLHFDQLSEKGLFGFRPFSSTEHALNTIISYTNSALLHTRNQALVVTQDVQKALHTVCHTGLNLFTAIIVFRLHQEY